MQGYDELAEGARERYWSIHVERVREVEVGEGDAEAEGEAEMEARLEVGDGTEFVADKSADGETAD